jgi:hypothetical protein
MCMDCVRAGKHGAGENGRPSRVAINIVNAREDMEMRGSCSHILGTIPYVERW